MITTLELNLSSVTPVVGFLIGKRLREVTDSLTEIFHAASSSKWQDEVKSFMELLSTKTLHYATLTKEGMERLLDLPDFRPEDE